MVPTGVLKHFLSMEMRSFPCTVTRTLDHSLNAMITLEAGQSEGPFQAWALQGVNLRPRNPLTTQGSSMSGDLSLGRAGTALWRPASAMTAACPGPWLSVSGT